MRVRLLLVSSLAVAAVIGMRSGREGLDAVSRRVRGLTERPELQQAAGLLQVQGARSLHRLYRALPLGRSAPQARWIEPQPIHMVASPFPGGASSLN